MHRLDGVSTHPGGGRLKQPVSRVRDYAIGRRRTG
jgi:hypothetical protein